MERKLATIRTISKTTPIDGWQVVVVRNYINDISFKIINPNFLLKYNE